MLPGAQNQSPLRMNLSIAHTHQAPGDHLEPGACGSYERDRPFPSIGSPHRPHTEDCYTASCWVR